MAFRPNRPFPGQRPALNSQGRPFPSATGSMAKYMPGINQPPVLAAPREVMPPGFQGGFPNGEAPQPPDNSIPPWMRPGGPMQTPFSNPPQNMVPPLNGPQVSVAKPPISAPPQPGPPPQQQQTVADTSGPQIGTVNWNSSLIWNGSSWDMNPNGPLAPKPPGPPQMIGPPATAQAAPPPINDWMSNPIYGTPVSPPTGFMGTLGNAIGGFAGPVMRQFNGTQTLPPQLTNNGPVSPVTRRY